MATRPVNSISAVPVTVHLSGERLANLDAVNKVVANTLGKLGCPGCFSGFDLRFNHVRDLVVNPKTFEVNDQFGGR